MKKIVVICAISAMLLGLASSVQAAPSIVNVTEISSGARVTDQWYQNGTTSGGKASIVDLTGLGGNLENNQPLPIGAVKLTTTLSTSSKAEISTFHNFGSAATVLNNIRGL